MGKFRFIEYEDEDEFGEAGEGAPSASESAEFEALLNESDAGSGALFQNLRVSDKVRASVMQVGREALYLDLGGKLTGVVSVDEWNDEILPEQGQEIELFVKKVTGSEVELTRILKSEGGGAEEWLSTKESGAPVEATVEKVVNGGFRVKCGQSSAFVPISHMDLAHIDKPEDFVGKTLAFQVMEVKENGRNLLFSRRQLLREEQDEAKRKLLNELTEGETRLATVTKLMPFGAFAKLGEGVEGLIPLSELAWKRVNKAADIVTVGDEVQVKVLKIEHAPKLKISLSLKDAGTDPWVLAQSQLEPGQVVEGRVTRIADFGAFVEMASGIEGLVHISQLSWTKRIRHPGDVLREGEKHAFTVLSLSPSERKLSLSFRGEMPEEMRNKIQKAANAGELTAEEKELMQEWNSYQEKRQQHELHVGSADSGILAAAFASAKRKST